MVHPLEGLLLGVVVRRVTLSSYNNYFFAIIAHGFQIFLKHAPAALILNVLWVVKVQHLGETAATRP